MKIHEFSLRFPDENSCRLHFKMVRENEGVTCKNCKGTKHYWLQSKWQWQCSKCRFRTTLRSGTVMESAKLSFHKWYLCMMYMSGTKKGVSALEMQRQLGILVSSQAMSPIKISGISGRLDRITGLLNL